MSSPFTFLAAMALVLAAPAEAQRREPAAPYAEAQRGKIMPLPKIEARVREHPAVKGADYLGPEYNEAAATYRLKFMRGGRVIFVDVDARSGRVLQTSGN